MIKTICTNLRKFPNPKYGFAWSTDQLTQCIVIRTRRKGVEEVAKGEIGVVKQEIDAERRLNKS